MSKLRTIRPLISTLDTRTVRVSPKTADPFYLTPEYRAWRDTVVERAGRRCQSVEHGERCAKAEPAHRMFADHIVELRDGGALYDVHNGMCLCGSHHTAKTMRARAARMGARGG